MTIDFSRQVHIRQPAPPGECPFCGRTVTVKDDGTLRSHRRYIGVQLAISRERCVGSGMKPRERS